MQLLLIMTALADCPAAGAPVVHSVIDGEDTLSVWESGAWTSRDLSGCLPDASREQLVGLIDAPGPLVTRGPSIGCRQPSHVDITIGGQVASYTVSDGRNCGEVHPTPVVYEVFALLGSEVAREQARRDAPVLVEEGPCAGAWSGRYGLEVKAPEGAFWSSVVRWTPEGGDGTFLRVPAPLSRNSMQVELLLRGGTRRVLRTPPVEERTIGLVPLDRNLPLTPADVDLLATRSVRRAWVDGRETSLSRAERRALLQAMVCVAAPLPTP